MKTHTSLIRRPSAHAQCIVWLLMLMATVCDLRSQCCVNLSGDWDVEETATFTVYSNGEFEDEFTEDAHATIRITQSGCKITFYSEKPDPFDSERTIKVLRTGMIQGETITFTGVAAVPIPGVSCPTNKLVGTGTISPSSTGFGATISFDTSGRIFCRRGRETAEIIITGYSTFTAYREIDFPPQVEIQPASRAVTNVLSIDGTLQPGPNVTFMSSITDDSNVLGYQWLHNGKSIPQATNDTLTLTNVRCAQAGTYLLNVKTPGCTLTGNPAILTVNGSTNSVDAPPMLTVSQPSGGSTRISNQVATIRGTAKDNRMLAGVYLQSGLGPFVRISTSTNWTANVNLSPGTNVFRLKAVDTCGNASPVITRTLIFVPSSPLTLVVGAGGKVSGATNGQLLALGTNYTLTAMASNGFVFSNWTGGVLSYTNKLTFIMTSNLVIEANFVPNPFIPTKGAYNGLFYDTSGVLHESSGFFTATVTDKGLFTGSLQANGKRHSISGAFDLNGRATNRVNRPGTNALTLELQLDVANGTDKITGTVSDGTWTAGLMADRTVFNSRTNPATNYVGKYTLIIPGSTNGMLSPGGDGFGTITVDAGGTVNFNGRLADDTPATQRVPLSKNGEWPLFVSLYSGRGSVLSWVTFTNRPSDDLHGLLSWIKPGLPLAKYYPMGFTNQTLLEGSIYVPPGTNRVLNLTNGVVVLSGGSLNQSSTNEVVLRVNNKVTNLSSNKLTLTIVPATGLFSGSVTPVGSPKAIPIKGVLLQKQNFGSGYFLGTNRSGQVWFGPAE